MKLFLKGERCFKPSCGIEKRNFPPGQHGRDRKAKIVGYRRQGEIEEECSGRERARAGGRPWNSALAGTEQRKCVWKSRQPAETRRHQPAYTGKNDRGVVLQINSPRNLRPARGH